VTDEHWAIIDAWCAVTEARMRAAVALRMLVGGAPALAALRQREFAYRIAAVESAISRLCELNAAAGSPVSLFD
jgi:hypothetical protein